MSKYSTRHQFLMMFNVTDCNLSRKSETQITVSAITETEFIDTNFLQFLILHNINFKQRMHQAHKTGSN